MLSKFIIKKYFAIAFSLFMLSAMSLSVFAQPANPEGRKSPGRSSVRSVKRTPTPQQRNFLDSRYQHNRSYLARGQSVRTLPRDHRVVMYGNSRYYSSNGVWYRPYRGRFSVVAPPIGLFVPFLPLAYATIWMQGIPYYYANETYYTQTPGGYVVVEPPQGEVSETPPDTEREASSDIADDKMFIYPRNGQSEKQQDKDRYDCHKWAVEQTNYDPTRTSTEISPDQIRQKRAEYQRVMIGCLDSRGYTAK